MYQAMGYIVYRTVLEYYSGNPDEDAYGTWYFVSRDLQHLECYSLFACFFLDMRKALSRDVDKESIIPLDHPVRPEEVE